MTDAGPSDPLELADDGLLAGRAADGDARAFGVLLRRHSPALRAYVNRLTRRPSDTDDVLQDVALAAWQALPRLQDPDAVRPWLFRITERQAFAQIRKAPQHAQIDEELSSTDDPTARSDVRRMLDVALSALPIQQSRAWVLREVGGHSYEEIAELLDVPESTVRGALVQARRKLLTAMGDAR